MQTPYLGRSAYNMDSKAFIAAVTAYLWCFTDALKPTMNRMCERDTRGIVFW